MNTLLNRSFVSVIFAQIASLFGDAVLRFALPLPPGFPLYHQFLLIL